MITFPSLKDRSFQKKYPNRLTCQILVLGEHEWFEEYEELPCGNRGEAYESLKGKWISRLTKVFKKFYPELIPCIKHVDLSTPLTIQHYLRDPKGGAIGLDVTPQRFTNRKIVDMLGTETSISGLWLTGQDMLCCGVPLAQASGLITAYRLLGTESFFQIFKTVARICRHAVLDGY